MADGLQYKIGADVTGLQRGVDQATKSLTKLEQSSAKAIKGIGASAAGGVASLNSLGQVARDLPFGFIAIQNNLPIVADQFSNLVKSSGGVGGALKSVGAALVGPAGISFAIGAVIAGVTALISKYGSLGEAANALFGTSKALSESQKKTAEGIANELSEVALLVSLYPQLEGQRERQNAILKKLNDIAPTYFKGLNSEKLTVDELTKSYDKYTKSLLAKAFVDGNQELIRVKAAEAAKELIRLNNLQIQGAKKRASEANKLKDFVALEERLSKVQSGTRRGDIAIGIDETAFVDTFDSALNKIISKFNEDVKNILSGTEGIVSKLDFGSVFDDLDKKKPKVKVDVVAEIGQVATIVSDFVAKADKEITRQFLQSNIEVPVKLDVSIPDSARKSMSDFAEIELSKLENRLAQTKDFSDALAASISEGLGNVFTEIGSGLGNIFAGVGSGLDVVSAAGIALADILISIGKLAISTGVATKGIFAALKGHPVAAIIGGVALVALGTAVKAKMAAKVPKFAEGGIVTRPTAGIFGEAGPEAVMPLEKLNSLINNTGGGGRFEFAPLVIRGNDLYASVKQTQRQQGRAF